MHSIPPKQWAGSEMPRSQTYRSCAILRMGVWNASQVTLIGGADNMTSPENTISNLAPASFGTNCRIRNQRIPRVSIQNDHSHVHPTLLDIQSVISGDLASSSILPFLALPYITRIWHK